MRITVTRTGGFAGITRRATLETQGRPDAEELAALARSALAEGRGEMHMVVPDGFVYEVEADGDKGHFADPRLTEAQSALVRKVLKEGT
ncbi:protealysin inhibitor emfourin [Streptomyces albidus (ex Kaewkla and Franco 2022)]|uniref:protealysin inhibitor emfourin n=1 Tax=Streptomyces albidus (ex Kaewkla and Franco 2022) TaxID=722709 RepID=UPI0015EF544E|nr:protealysin inhibitor emfourin [Streptomyces albidus (ex Kaewkla and Franco 2022)]